MKIENLDVSQGITKITLNNGICWIFKGDDLLTANDTEENAFEGWRIGDHVSIVYRWIDGRYYLKNLSSNAYIPVKMSRSIADSHGIARILAISESDERTRTRQVMLDDGSEWLIGAFSRLEMDRYDWQKGDRVIVTPHKFNQLFNRAEHLMINLDRERAKRCPSSVRAQIGNGQAGSIEEPTERRPTRSFSNFIGNIFYNPANPDHLIVMLDNGMLLEMTQQAWDQSTWNIGDEIVLNGINGGLDHELYMKNLSTSSSMNLKWINSNAPKKAPSFLGYTRIQKISRDKITLNDGSMWMLQVGQNMSIKKNEWQVSDQVIVLPLSCSEEVIGYAMFNQNRPSIENGFPTWSEITLMR